jgi:hypothetical protein
MSTKIMVELLQCDLPSLANLRDMQEVVEALGMQQRPGVLQGHANLGKKGLARPKSNERKKRE